jgi:hypothetical protein
MLVKYSSLEGGVFIEENGSGQRKPQDRCFRFDKSGNAEYASVADLVRNGARARWFGHQFKERDFAFA